MATIFTVPLKGTRVTIKAGTKVFSGQTLARNRSVMVDAVSVYPDEMIVTAYWRNALRGYRITDPNMIEWND